MKNYLKVDDRNKRLIMDRTFDKNRQIVGSPEYDMLQRAKADYPHYTVELRRIKKNPEKETYKHLNYAYMREYISRHPLAELRMAEFEEKCLRAGKNDNPFHRVRDWFFEAYPEINDFTPEQYREECVAKETSSSHFEVIADAA